MITLKGATLRRGTRLLLDQADYAIHPGRRIGVIGPNGCGKSSLFRLLLGELVVDAGELNMPSRWRLAHMAQEAAHSDRSALQFVIDGDKRLREVEAAIESSGDDRELGRLYAELEVLDGYHAEIRAAQLLHGLGFDQTETGRPVSSFSGGWRIRLNLAQALMCPSELLLLDEPTNHLDLDATLWLEQWLKSYPGTLLLISHDRDFLDNIADEILSFEGCRMCSYRGNYSAYEKQRAEHLAQQQAGYEKQQRRIDEINRYVNRFRAKATKARQAQSRLKELERMALIAPAHIDSPFSFSIPAAEKSSTPLVNLRDVSLGYDESVVLSGVGLSLRPGSRLGLLGPNGAGKSTLVKCLVGELAPLEGDRICGEHLAIGYFAQHQMEALDLQASAALHIQRLTPGATEQQIRNFLGGFDFHGDKALEPIAPFSGGEKARLALALIVWQKPNLLLLDEPSNHLDLEMRHALEMALQAYTGALVIISHDRHLLRNTVDEFYLVADRRVQPFAGTLIDYHDWLKHSPRGSETAVPAGGDNSVPDSKVRRQAAAQKRHRLAPLKKRVRALESGLDRAQQQLSVLAEQLLDPSLYSDGDKTRLQELLREQGALQRQVSEQEALWLEAHEELDDLQSG